MRSLLHNQDKVYRSWVSENELFKQTNICPVSAMKSQRKLGTNNSEYCVSENFLIHNMNNMDALPCTPRTGTIVLNLAFCQRENDMVSSTVFFPNISVVCDQHVGVRNVLRPVYFLQSRSKLLLKICTASTLARYGQWPFLEFWIALIPSAMVHAMPGCRLHRHTDVIIFFRAFQAFDSLKSRKKNAER